LLVPCCGKGELHLEVIETKLRDEFKIPIITSPPIVIYRETITKKAGPIEGKTPNKHSKFYVTVEPLPEGLQNAIDEGTLREGKPKGQAAIEVMVAAGLDRAIAKNVEDISNKCMLADVTHGVQYMNEVMELLIDGFREAVKDGPLARERCSGVLVSVVDATIHEDPVHRGPAQIIPAIRNAIYAGMLTAGVSLYEPKQNFTINIPQEYMSGVITFVQSKRGTVTSVTQENEQVSIVAKMPVAETLKGFSNDLRGLTQGRAIWYTEFAGYEKLPTELQNKVVREIRERKGQNPEPPTPDQFLA
ncbi:intein-containing elongation factor EF-2, partial [Candidatus Marsarchaeota archaeon]|nr:intein-containing elongation factor EF-2 [Candidatus Marsarchaeota archaeon]